MSDKTTQKPPEFGDKNYDYTKVKVNDEDAQGETILTIFYTTEKMIIYRTKGNLIVSYSNHADRFSTLNVKKQEIENLIQLSADQKILDNPNLNKEQELENLRTLYAPQLAHAYQMCYLEKYEEGILIAENVAKSIEDKIISKVRYNNLENKIISEAQYTYFKFYLKYLCYVFIVLAIVFIWNSVVKTKEYEIQNWFVWHFYMAVAGVIGSFISAKEKVAKKAIDFNIPVKRTVIDVKFRLFLGGIFGIITVWLVYSEILTGILSKRMPDDLFTQGEGSVSEIITVLIIAIVGGFSERLVPDTLKAREKAAASPTKKINSEIEKLLKQQAEKTNSEIEKLLE